MLYCTIVVYMQSICVIESLQRHPMPRRKTPICSRSILKSSVTHVCLHAQVHMQTPLPSCPPRKYTSHSPLRQQKVPPRTPGPLSLSLSLSLSLPKTYHKAGTSAAFPAKKKLAIHHSTITARLIIPASFRMATLFPEAAMRARRVEELRIEVWRLLKCSVFASIKV